MKSIINKIIAVEGLDKTGKSTFVSTFESVFNDLHLSQTHSLHVNTFPNTTAPIGQSIRAELASSIPNPNIVNSPNFLADMSHFWMEELFQLHFNNIGGENTTNSLNSVPVVGHRNYIFDRYFISTLAYQAFYNNSKADLEFIKSALLENKFIKMPTDLIMFNLPNATIIERTLADQNVGLTDINDTIDETVLDKRRMAYESAINFLKGTGVRVHWFEDSSLYQHDDLSKVLIGKIFR